MNIIIPFPELVTGVHYHRLKMPFSLIKGNIKFLQKVDPEVMAWADVMIISRDIGNSRSEVRQICDFYKIKLIYDFDDSPFLDHTHRAFADYQKNKVTENQLYNVSISDCVWVTNERLKKVLLTFNTNIDIIPNSIPLGYDQFNESKNPSERIRFIYAGGTTHYKDLLLIENTCRVLRKNEKFKSIGQMVMAGYSDNPKYKDYWDKAEALYSGQRPNWETYKRVYQLLTPEYMNLYKDGDVGLVPLVDNEFNRCKSNLKLLELGAKKLPAIVSYMPTYTDNNPPVKWVKKQSDWLEYIMFYINHPEKIKEDGEKLYEWVKTYYSMDDVNTKRIESIKRLLN